MLLMGGCISLFSTLTVRNEVRRIMNYIVENDGEMPVSDSPDSTASSVGPEDNTALPHPQKKNDWSLRSIFGTGDFTGQTEDSVYSTQYFAVLFDRNGEVEKVITSHLTSVDDHTAEQYALFVLQYRKRFGSFGRYYYQIADRVNTGDTEAGNGVIVIYLDRSTQLMAINRVIFIALMLLGVGTILAFFLMRIFSDQVVRSEVENAERQKQFITNASHELKTPLAVIRANTEMQEMLEGETEWTQSTMRQVDRLSGLVQNLVQISRAQEKATGELSVLNISPAVLETTDSFIPVARGDGKKLTHKIAANVSMVADESLIRQLLSLLVDNAVKYCDPDGEIRVILTKSVRTVQLTVTNSYADGASVDYSRFFERFYRRDDARTIENDTVPAASNSQKSGYGIGLSVVDELVKTLHGTIHVTWKNGVISFICRFRSAS